MNTSKYKVHYNDINKKLSSVRVNFQEELILDVDELQGIVDQLIAIHNGWADQFDIFLIEDKELDFIREYKF